MKNIFKSRKAKLIIETIFFVVSFSLGAFARPGIDMVGMLVSSVFVSKPEVYVAKPTEYEQAVNELWHSDAHQAVCRANAGATVALQFAHKYLDEADKENALSQFETPLSQAVINVSKKK